MQINEYKMRWTDINARLLQLENKELTEGEIEEWNTLIEMSQTVPGTIIRRKKHEKAITKAREENAGEEKTH